MKYQITANRPWHVATTRFVDQLSTKVVESFMVAENGAVCPTNTQLLWGLTHARPNKTKVPHNTGCCYLPYLGTTRMCALCPTQWHGGTLLVGSVRSTGWP